MDLCSALLQPPVPGNPITFTRDLSFVQIGAEGGLFRSPVGPMNYVVLGLAERAEIVVDFSGLAPGSSLWLLNDAPAPFPGGGDPPLPEIMRFDIVANTHGADTSSVPATLSSVTPLLPANAVVTRDLTLEESLDFDPPRPQPPYNSPKRLGLGRSQLEHS